MKQLILIHPGATEYDQQGRIQGTLDVPLSDDGREQVARMAAELSTRTFSSLYTAPGQPAKQTGEILGDALDLKPKTLEKLTNVDQGLWQGMCVDDVKTKQPKLFKKWLEKPESVCPPEGEPIPHACQRAAEVLGRLRKKVKPNSTVLLVVPEPMASIVRHVLCGQQLENPWTVGNSPGRWECIDLDAPQRGASEQVSEVGASHSG